MPIFGVGRSAACAKGILGAALMTMICGAAPVAADEITVTIDSLQALDRIDPGGGRADFYAQVTIAGSIYRTPPIRKADVVRPKNWTFSKHVRPGTYDVRIEIFDKDLFSKDDQIDINRLDGKRDLDFRVRTRPCAVLDFAEPYVCRGRGVTVTRAGRENKSAEIRFTVDASR